MKAQQAGKILSAPLGIIRQIPKILQDSLEAIPGAKTLVAPYTQQYLDNALGFTPEVYNVMKKNGIIPEWDLAENQTGLISLFSNTPFENAVSMSQGIANMRFELIRNGIDP